MHGIIFFKTPPKKSGGQFYTVFPMDRRTPECVVATFRLDSSREHLSVTLYCTISPM